MNAKKMQNALVQRVDGIGKTLLNEIKQTRKQRAGPKRPVEMRDMSIPRAISELESFHRYSRARYLYGLIHPDAAVRDGMQVKLYSDVPLPTSSAGIKETFYLTPSLNGTFAIAWSPSFIGTLNSTQNTLTAQTSLTDPYSLKQYQYSHCFYNNQNIGSRINEGQWIPWKSYTPEINFQRYRLVSALMKVQYVGSVMDQAGVMNSCATFDDIPPLILWNTQESDQDIDIENTTIEAGKVEYTNGYVTQSGYVKNAYNNLARFSDFNLVKNGLWNTTHNITANAKGVECLYIPMDTTDTTFKVTGSYYDTKPYPIGTQATHYTAMDALQLNSAATPIKYIVTGQGFSNTNTNSVLVEIYYNFEVIADPSTAPFLRAEVNDYMNRNDNQTIIDSFKNWVKSNKLIRAARAMAPTFRNFLQRHTGWLSSASRWGNNIEPLLIGA